MRRHQHGDWTVISATYDPPRRRLTRAGRMRASDMERLVQGATRIVQRCGGCGWVEVTSVTGDVRVPITQQHDGGATPAPGALPGETT